MIDEYIRLGRKYGGAGGGPPKFPPSWEVSTRRRIEDQGGLGKIDMEQYKAWNQREKTEQGEEVEKYKKIEKIKEKYKQLPEREKSFLRTKAATQTPGTLPWWLRIGEAMQGEV